MQECTQRGSADNKSTQSDKNSSKLKLNVNDINNGELKLHINNENNNKVNMKDNNNRNYNNKNSGIWQLFLRTMRTMGKRRFMYYGSILGDEYNICNVLSYGSISYEGSCRHSTKR